MRASLRNIIRAFIALFFLGGALLVSSIARGELPTTSTSTASHFTPEALTQHGQEGLWFPLDQATSLYRAVTDERTDAQALILAQSHQLQVQDKLIINLQQSLKTSTTALSLSSALNDLCIDHERTAIALTEAKAPSPWLWLGLGVATGILSTLLIRVALTQ